MDYKLKLGNWHVETSIYNGTGYNMFVGKENVFRFCPKTDGILSITSLNYQNNDSGYSKKHSGTMCQDIGNLFHVFVIKTAGRFVKK